MNNSIGTRDEAWSVILAGGRGRRLARLTRALYGREVPKQFAALDGDRTMLQQTMARATQLTPAERSFVVVSDEHGALAREQLASFSGVRVVEQPRDVGTLPGLLLPLAHVLAAQANARVVVYPSDHHIERLGPFTSAVKDALRAVEQTPARTVLVGARAERAETDLGWILPGHGLSADAAVRAVESFVEKPTPRIAARLLKNGALWNTLLIALDAEAFWRGALEARPELAAPFERYRASLGTACETSVKLEVYARLPTLDLSRDLLAKHADLAVVEMSGAGWSDCGTPERLAACLAGEGRLGWLRARLGASYGALERGTE